MGGKIITIVNRACGSGKSWISQNLTKNLSLFGRVLLVDLDPQGDSSRYFNVSREFSIKNIFDKSKDFPDVVHKTDSKNLFLLPANIELSQISDDQFSRDRTVHIANYLKTKFDYIVVDTPPDFKSLVRSSVDVSDRVIYPIMIDERAGYLLEEFFREFNDIKERMVLIPTQYREELISIYADIYSRYSEKFIKKDGEVLKLEIGKSEIDKFNYLILSIKN